MNRVVNEELVSVVITTYKRSISVLQRAIDSVVGQTYAAIEIIVVNDYPEDKETSNNIKGLLLKYSGRTIQYRCV